MTIIATDQPATQLALMLEGYDCPAILVSVDYRILATNRRYQEQFGNEHAEGQFCYQVSHGYTIPCDQAGEDCPLGASQASGHKERVLHIHQTPRGPEHVDVELIPIPGEDGAPAFFVELMHSIPVAGSDSTGDRSLVGQTAAFNRMLGKVARVSASEAAVLLLGESGTGKELVASAIHQASYRKDKSLVTLECAGLSDSLFESELFGHVRGAFTGASGPRKGLVELADGGTLFLDEIGDVPLSMQVKLLRLIETGTYRAVGASQVRHSDFRLICATHKNLSNMAKSGAFRHDLYHRINVFPVRLPALRDRMGDLPLLVRTLLKRISPTKEIILADMAYAELANHSFPGNIRELRNILNRAIILSDTEVIGADVINEALDINYQIDRPLVEQAYDITANKAADTTAEDTASSTHWVGLKTAEKQYLQKLMAVFNDDKERVAQIAGVSVRTLYRKLHD